MQIYGNCWICVCISSSHPTRLVCAASRSPCPPWLTPSFSGPWWYPSTNHISPTANNSEEVVSRRLSIKCPRPTMLETLQSHYSHPPCLSYLSQCPLCSTAVRSASPHSARTRARAVEKAREVEIEADERNSDEEESVPATNNNLFANQLTCSHLII